MNKNVIFIGAGDYATSVYDSMKGYELVAFIDDKMNGEHIGRPIIGDSISLLYQPHDFYYFITIGDSEARQAWYGVLKEMDLPLINIIDETAIISKNCRIGEGNFIGKGAIINNNVVIGNNNMINSGAVIEHHCYIGDHARISPRAVLNGNVIVEDGALIGSNAVCRSDQRIGRFAKLGAGAVLLGDMEPRSTYVGVPAHRIKSESSNFFRKISKNTVHG